MVFNRLEKFIEVSNNFYAFALLVYAVILYFSGHYLVLVWLLIVASPLLAGWTGFLLHGFYERHYLYHGFKILADTMTYELGPKQRATLRYDLELQAKQDNLLVYPIAHEWTGIGSEQTPELADPRQSILGVITQNSDQPSLPQPYSFDGTSAGNWKYWFVAFKPGVSKNQIVRISYKQKFVASVMQAKPQLSYTPQISMKRLTLNVRLPAGAKPESVMSGFSKPYAPRQVVPQSELQFDPDKEWVTWVIHKPKRGYTYSITWKT